MIQGTNILISKENIYLLVSYIRKRKKNLAATIQERIFFGIWDFPGWGLYHVTGIFFPIFFWELV